MRINHRSIFNVKDIEKAFTERDGVPIKYVCTTELDTPDVVFDIFYRSTRHPKFKNHYFGLTISGEDVIIVNADSVEKLKFAVVPYKGKGHYSRAQHDYVEIGNGGSVDGGRQYIRLGGQAGQTYLTYIVKDGVLQQEK